MNQAATRFHEQLLPFITAATGRKAENVTVLEVGAISSIADAFIICSGNSNRQVSAIAEHIHTELKKADIYPLSMDGLREGHWVTMDYGHVVLHIFYQPIRETYDLEGLWSDAKRIDIDTNTPTKNISTGN